MFPPPWAFARLGEAIADMRNADATAQCRQQAGQWEQYAQNLEYRLAQYHEEYARLMDYTAQLKALYTHVRGDALRMHGIDEYPLPPAGTITSLASRITALNFFESGSNLVPKENRVYKTVFSRASTRFLCWELNLKHIALASRMDFEITTYWYPPDLAHGSEPSTFHTKSFILPEWEGSHHADGYGFDEADRLPVGSYKMQFWVGDEFISQGEVELS